MALTPARRDDVSVSLPATLTVAQGAAGAEPWLVDTGLDAELERAADALDDVGLTAILQREQLETADD